MRRAWLFVLYCLCEYLSTTQSKSVAREHIERVIASTVEEEIAGRAWTHKQPRHPFADDPRVKAFLQTTGCPSSPRMEKEAVLGLVEAVGEDEASPSMLFRRDLVSLLYDGGFGVEQRTALEVGVGWSGTTLLLSALFCKVIAIEIHLKGAVTHGLPHVMHLRKDSTSEHWHRELMSEGPAVDFIFVDGSHRFIHASRDLPRALWLLSVAEARKPRHERHNASSPLIAWHDANIQEVRESIEFARSSGVLRDCAPLGELRPNTKDGFDRDEDWSYCRKHGTCALTYRKPLFREGWLCRVEAMAAAAVANSAAPDYHSILPPPGTPWLLFSTSAPDFPWGVVRIFADSHQAIGGDLAFQEGRAGRMWWGRWRQTAPLGSKFWVLPEVVSYMIKTAKGMVFGEFVISMSRGSMAGHLRRLQSSENTDFTQRNLTEIRSLSDVMGTCFAMHCVPPASGEPCKLPDIGPTSQRATKKFSVSLDDFPMESWLAIPVDSSPTGFALNEANIAWNDLMELIKAQKIS